MAYTEQDLIQQVARGEDSTHQFKENIQHSESLAAEMVALANTEGGHIYLGVADDGSIPGLSSADAARLNQLISNVASQMVRSPLTVFTENVTLKNDKLVIVVSVPKGLDKPYFDKNGIIWLKNGSDKRRLNSKEELRRIFQAASQFHADELPTKAGIDKLDKLLFRDFLSQEYGLDFPDAPGDLIRLLQNLTLATGDGVLNFAGTLMFAEHPERILPQFTVKAVRFLGTDIGVSDYADSEDFSGPMPRLFRDAFAFIMRNLHKVQAGHGVNAPGTSEVPGAVFEELLVNAFVHRDYLISAPIRIFIYADRIEIISPGHLPNNLSVEKIKAGISVVRNPILVSYAAKGLLPYHGIGSGVLRALKNWKYIDFIDDRDLGLFKSIIYRKGAEPGVSQTLPSKAQEPVAKDQEVSPKGQEVSPNGQELSPKGQEVSPKGQKVSPKGQEVSPKKQEVSLEKQALVTERTAIILATLRQQPEMTIEGLAETLGLSRRTILRLVDRLKVAEKIRRVGPARGGRWEVL